MLFEVRGSTYDNIKKIEYRNKGTVYRTDSSFSGGPHAPVNMADSMEEVNVGAKNAGNGILETSAPLYCVGYISYATFRKSLTLFGTSIFGSRNSPTMPCLQELVTRQRS